MEEFQAAAHLVDTFAEVEYLGIDFEHSEKEALKKKAVAQALDDADAWKRVIEEKLSVRLVPKGFKGLGAPERDSIGKQPDSQVGTVTGILSDPSFRVGTRALVVGGEPGPSFDQLLFTARVAIEYAVESE